MFGWNTLPPIIMVQWKRAASDIRTSFHFEWFSIEPWLWGILGSFHFKNLTAKPPTSMLSGLLYWRCGLPTWTGRMRGETACFFLCVCVCVLLRGGVLVMQDALRYIQLRLIYLLWRWKLASKYVDFGMISLHSKSQHRNTRILYIF